jgi:hypothetical protein
MIKLNLHKQFDEVKPMRVPLLLQTIFIKSRAAIDKRLHRLVLEVSEVLSIHKKLSIAGLGRALKRPAKVKHNIKAVDRLFGNMKLAQKSIMFYQERTLFNWSCQETSYYCGLVRTDSLRCLSFFTSGRSRWRTSTAAIGYGIRTG